MARGALWGLIAAAITRGRRPPEVCGNRGVYAGGVSPNALDDGAAVTRLIGMRRMLPLVFVGLGLAIAVTGQAAPGGPAPTTPPPPSTPNPPVLAGVKAGSYTPGGPLQYEVRVSNPADKAVTTTLVVTGAGHRVASVPVSVPAKATVTVAFQDPAGLQNVCHVATHRLSLETGGPGGTRWLRTTPTCRLSAKLVDPSAIIPPDTRAAQRANHVYLASHSLVAGPTCDAPLTFEATIHNGSSVWAKTGLAIAGPISASEPLQTEMKPGWTSNPHTLSVQFDGRLGDYALRVHSDAPTYDSGWHAAITAPSCELDAKLD